MKTSILDLKKEIYQDKTFQFHARIKIIFMTRSSHTFALLDPASLPTENVVLDVWVLRNQDVILTTGYQTDNGLNWEFSTFIQNMRTNYQQEIIIVKQQYNQVLVLKSGIFSMENFNSTDMYLAKNSSHLFQVATLFDQIIEQENSFLTELQTFQNMLNKAEILTTTSTVPPKVPTKTKRDIIGAKIKNSAQIRIKRNIGDIFSPYSTTSIGDTANSNYKRMNHNFAKIHITEKKLTHAQQSLSKNIGSLQKHEIELLKKEIFLELRTLTDSALNDFIFDLKQILSTNHLDKSYDIIFSLLRDAEFCFQSLCYSLPIFNSFDKNIVTVSVQTTKQSLAKGYYISCTILPNHRTSVYSHQMAILSDDMLHFKEDGLASISFEDLKHSNIDFLTRSITSEDMLVDQFYPIYSGQKVSLQCLNPIHVVINSNQKMWCNQNSMQFIDFPEEITINGKVILSVHVPQHFSMKMAELTHDFEVLSQFSNVNVTEPNLMQEVVSYFETAETIHWSFLTLVLVSICSFVVLSFFCCYLKCPTLITKVFSCCCTKSCCLMKCFSKRVAEKTMFRSKVEYNLPAENVQLIDMNNVQPAQNPNVNSVRRTPTPSAPNLSLDSQMSNLLNQNRQPFVQPLLASGPNFVQPLASGPIATAQIVQRPEYSFTCKSGFPSCFCKKNNQQCKGAPQLPPF